VRASGLLGLVEQLIRGLHGKRGLLFAPGHDAKRKSALWARARQGQHAVDELRRRKWAIPPEMR